VSLFTVYLTPEVYAEIKDLPGYIKQRIKSEITSLSQNPRPSNSKSLNTSEFEHELRRIRLERWRIVYSIVEEDKSIDILAIRKRPPYDYGDLESLLEGIK
jgi:mRNA interferase RelE/StbE